METAIFSGNTQRQFVASSRKTWPLRWPQRGLVGLALLASVACTGTAAASATIDKEANQPNPVAVQAPTQADEARMRLDAEAALANEGVASQERVGDQMLARGLNPADPVARNAYLAEAAASRVDSPTGSPGLYMLDPSWGTAGIAADRYAGPPAGTYRGIKAAALPNGDIVVAGQLSLGGGITQLGLTRRGAHGQRIPWPGAQAPYGQYNDEYLIYPSTDASKPPIYKVLDIKVSHNRIYVLVTGHLSSPDTYAPNVVIFNMDGSFGGYFFAYSDGNNEVNDAVAMDISYGDGSLIVLGRHSLGNTGGFWTARWTLNSGGGLDDATFGDFPEPAGNGNTEPADIAFRRVGSILYLAPKYYVLYSKTFSGDDHDPCLLLSSYSNVPDTDFGSSGVRCKPFDQPDSTLRDQAVALTTNGFGDPLNPHEGVQVLVSVARSNRDGIGIWQLLDRVDHPVFGAGGLGGGRVVFGGCASSAGCGVLGLSHTPTDLVLSGNYDLVSGYNYSTLFSDSLPFLAKVQGNSGDVEQLTSFGVGYADGYFNSLVPRSNSYVVGIGEAIDDSLPASARTQIMVGLTTINDTIFANGFD